jgi:eukaryotic-like serine/threonine-protein kinase
MESCASIIIERVGARFGRYELVRPLGHGGMAEVFLARYRGPEGFEKRLVIKRVLPQLAADRRFLTLFFDEARLQVSLSHGNLVPVFDFGRVGNAYFLAMDYVAGHDLGALLGAGRARGKTLSPALVAYIGAEVCRGLGYVHRRGFVHRDVTPRNILLSRDGEVKLSDFGVALAQQSEVAPGVRGTVAYMAPEQARAERPTPRTDLFALGIVIAEAATGRKMREGSDPEAALAAAKDPEPIVIEGPLAEIVARATAADPASRFADAESMQLALERVMSAEGLSGGAAGRELAATLREWIGDVDENAAATDQTLANETTAGEETYFRDGTVDSLEALLPQTPVRLASAPRRRVWPWIAAAVIVIGASVGATFGLTRKPTQIPVVIATPDAAPPKVVVQDPPPPVPTPTPIHRAPPPKPGRLLVRCTPWCIASIDGKKTGEGSRQHQLTVAAGRHRVIAERLQDRLDKTVDVAAGQSATVDFDFP